MLRFIFCVALALCAGAAKAELILSVGRTLGDVNIVNDGDEDVTIYAYGYASDTFQHDFSKWEALYKEPDSHWEIHPVNAAFPSAGIEWNPDQTDMLTIPAGESHFLGYTFTQFGIEDTYWIYIPEGSDGFLAGVVYHFPEPSTYVFMGMGLLTVVALKLRRRR